MDTIFKGGSRLYISKSLGADEALRLTLSVRQSQELTLDLTLYYCQAEDAQLCLIHRARRRLPLVIEDDGSTEVRIPHVMRNP